MEQSSNQNLEPTKKHNAFTYFEALDRQLLEAEKVLEEEKLWLEHDIPEEQLVLDWAENTFHAPPSP